MKNTCPTSFPWATLLVNLTGCFFIGLIYGFFAKYSHISHTVCLLLTTGFCGGFTTFSTFANEGLQMLHSGNISGFMGYVAANLILGIILVMLGYLIVK